MAELKTKATKTSAGALIKEIKDPKRRKDAGRLLAIFKKVTGEKPVIWGSRIVGFGSYHYESERSAQKGDWMRAGFGISKANIPLYIMSGVKQHPDLIKKLGKCKMSGGSCIYVTDLDKIHIPTLEKLIKESLKYMAKRYPKSKR